MLPSGRHERAGNDAGSAGIDRKPGVLEPAGTKGKRRAAPEELEARLGPDPEAPVHGLDGPRRDLLTERETMEELEPVLQHPWMPLLVVLAAVQLLVLVALLPWAIRQDRRRRAVRQAWWESLPMPLREAHRRSRGRFVVARAADVVLLVGLGFVVVVAFARRLGRPELEFSPEGLAWMFVITVVATVATAGLPWCTVRFGRTPGEAMCGLRTQRLDGAPLDWDTAWKLFARSGGFHVAQALTLLEEDWEHLRLAGVWPIAPRVLPGALDSSSY